MANYLHMEPEKVRAVARMIYNNAQNMQDDFEELWHQVNRLDLRWSSSQKDKFMHDFRQLRNQVNRRVDELFNFETRLEREVDEWENADARVGDGRRDVNNSEWGKLFVGGPGGENVISPSDIFQGAVGDCYLMASLAAIAAQNPDLIRDMITVNADGTYTIRFFNEQTGQAEYVTVSKSDIPVSMVDGQPIYAKYGDDGELWPALIEKAYAKWIDERNTRDPGWSQFLEKLGFAGKNDYELIKGGWPQVAMQQITGHPSVLFDPASGLSESDLISNLAKGNPVAIGTLPKTAISGNSLYGMNDGQLVAGHAYYITDYDQSTGMVTVHNPWGFSESQATVTLPLSELEKNIGMISINQVTP